MPQAIDFSLATPRIRPRLPAMIARGLAISLIIVLRRSAGTAALRALEKSARSWAEIGLARETVSQPRRAPLWDASSRSAVEPAQRQDGVGAAEAEAVRKREIDLLLRGGAAHDGQVAGLRLQLVDVGGGGDEAVARSEEHTSELQSLMRISYAVFCLKKNKTKQTNT